MNFLKKNLKAYLIWIAVIFPILIIIIAANYELSSYGLKLRDHPYLGVFLSPFDNVRYGHYIVQKLFLVVVAFLIFIYWLKKQRNLLKFIKSNFKYLSVIAGTLILSRILTFNFWYYNDDTRFFNWQLYFPTQPNYDPQGHWGPYFTYPIAVFLLVIRWFGTNYTLYNALGLFFYFLAGSAIFVLGNKIQKSKFVSLVAALFFLTTPTNFQGRLLIGEIINSPFAILLILLSIYMLLQKFIPGALIFAAAALEYGVAKTYITAVPLTLFTAFFAFFTASKEKMANLKKTLVFLVGAVFLISLVYINSFSSVVPKSRLLGEDVFDKLMIFGDVLLAVTIPLSIAQPLVKLLSQLLDKWIYITQVVGFSFIAVLAIIGLTAFVKGKTLAAKLIAIGLAVLIPTAAAGSMMGVRVDHAVPRLTEYVINTPIPTGATGYGALPALGLSFILMGMGSLLKKKAFGILAVSLLLINIVSSFVYDFRWMQSPYGYPQRRFNEQLQKSLHRDGIKKYVFVAASQRPLYQGVITFYDIFQGDQFYYQEMDPETFVSTLKKEKPRNDHIYFFVTSGAPKYDVYDYSDKIRNVPFDKMSSVLHSLTKQLVPERTEFYIF